MGVSHDALAVAGASAAEFASGDQRRLGSAGISAVGGHGVGEVQAASLDADEFFARAGNWFGGVADFEDLGAAEAGYDDGSHQQEFSSGCKGLCLAGRKRCRQVYTFGDKCYCLEGLRQTGPFHLLIAAPIEERRLVGL